MIFQPTGKNRIVQNNGHPTNILSKTETCQYCGAKLDPFIIEVFGKIRTVGFGACGCEGSTRYSEMARSEGTGKPLQCPSCIPYRYRDARGGGDYVRQVMDGRWLFIYGNVGAGKTYLASAILKHLSRYGSVEFVSAVDATSINASETLKSAKYLVIDDLGKETSSEWSVSRIWEIVNHRYNAGKPTIFTSQHTLEEIPERISRNGDYETALSIVSRMYEMCDTVHLTGTDRRIG